MAQISNGQVVMKPRWYFVVGSVLSLLGVLGTSMGAFFLMNLSLFLLRQHGPGGERRLALMISSFPWWIPVLAIVLLVAGIMALKRYDFSYRKNFTAIVAISVITLLVSAYIIDATGINDTWFGQGPMRRLYQANPELQENEVMRGNGMHGGRRGGGPQGGGADFELTVRDQIPTGSNLPDEQEITNQLDTQTVEYLQLALGDERKALATYEAVLAKFGQVRPFTNIAQAEKQHIAQLLELFNRYQIPVPPDTTVVRQLPATLAEVCAIGVKAEIDNDALYQKMLPAISQADIRQVFSSLAQASKQNHLPAFERCAR